MLSTLAPLTFADSEELALYLNCRPADGPRAWTADLADVPGDLWEFGIYCPGADPAHVAGLVGYLLRGPVAMQGEWPDDAVTVDCGGALFRFDPDLTKSCRDDPYWELSSALPDLLSTGTPIRKTDRAGAGTAGTRKWGPLAGPALIVWR